MKGYFTKETDMGMAFILPKPEINMKESGLITTKMAREKNTSKINMNFLKEILAVIKEMVMEEWSIKITVFMKENGEQVALKRYFLKLKKFQKVTLFIKYFL